VAFQQAVYVEQIEMNLLAFEKFAHGTKRRWIVMMDISSRFPLANCFA
jgi:hypothetical protein